jgi:anti-sigma factor RsiW
MTCGELSGFLDDHLDGSLPPPARKTFDAHLGECPECAAYLRSYATTIRLAKATADPPNAPIRDDVPEALVRAILAARTK